MKEDFKKDLFGQTLRKVRTSRGFTYRGLAVILGVSATYINDLERGNRLPTLEFISKLTSSLVLNEEEKKAIKIGYQYAHPNVVLSNDIVYYIIDNDLVDTLKELKGLDSKGKNLKRLVKKLGKSKMSA